jgi:hypothetical protein
MDKKDNTEGPNKKEIRTWVPKKREFTYQNAINSEM